MHNQCLHFLNSHKYLLIVFPYHKNLSINNLIFVFFFIIYYILREVFGNFYLFTLRRDAIRMEKLFFNGDILTMENESDNFDAVLISDGLIKSLGNFQELFEQKSDDCKLVDLQGKTLMPSFIDGHGHFAMASVLYLTKIDLEPAKNFNEIIQLIKDFIDEHHIPPGQPVAGYAYDHNFLEEKCHPDKRILDQASSIHPIIILHTSGHASVANSLALERAGINETSPEIQGGIIERYPNSNEPTGYLEETANVFVSQKNEPPIKDPVALLAEVQRIYAENGITTVQDGATFGNELDTICQAGKMGLLYLDIVSYPFAIGFALNETQDNVEKHKNHLGQYQDHVKIGGFKMTLDGSPQAKSAWMSKPYENSGNYCGYPWFSNDEVHQAVKHALNCNQQLLAHCNGDAASEQFLTVYEQELANCNNPNKNNLRPVMIHCQTVREDQLDRMEALNMIPSIFVAHTWYWGDIHLNNLGNDRGNRISPCKSALDRKLIYNLHTDTPVRLPKMLHTVWAAVNRRTQNGVTIGPDQRIDVYNALKGITINAAYSYFEEDSKGSIKKGKRADLVILDRNPLKVNPMEIQDIQVIETIKDGETIFCRE